MSRRSRSPSPEPQRRVQYDSETVRECNRNNVRTSGNFHNSDKTFSVRVDFTNIADFTTLFIFDILHDYFRIYADEGRTNKVVVTAEMLKFICDVAAVGFSEPVDEIYRDVMAVINRLSTQQIDGALSIHRFEEQISDFLQSRGFYNTENIAGINDKLSADACRRERVDAAPCKQYQILKQTPDRGVVTLATKIDSGFMHEHIDYNYCEDGLDYVLLNSRFSLYLRGRLFSKVIYEITATAPTLYYISLPIPPGSTEADQLRREDNLRYNKQWYRNKIDGAFNLRHDRGAESRKMQLFRLLLNLFHGDFAQILYAHAVSTANFTGGRMYMLTRDRMMTIVSAVMLKISVYTSKGNQLIKMNPGAVRRGDPTISVELMNIPARE